LGPKPETSGRAVVDPLCSELFFSRQARETEDNLVFVRDRLLRSEADPSALLTLYSAVAAGGRVSAKGGDPLVELLQLSGVVRVQKGLLAVRNRIYRRVFDRAWARRAMPGAELRRQRAAFRRGALRTAALGTLVVAMLAGLGSYAVEQS